MSSKKTCNGCGETKLREMFYSQRSGDGKSSKCKECIKAQVRKNRAENIEYYREHDRRRANKANRVAAREKYEQSTRGRLAMRRASESWSERNPKQRAANVAVGNALRDGRLTKGLCEICGTGKNIQGHHDDYDRPLDVRWLCAKHHAEHHKNERELMRQQA